MLQLILYFLQMAIKSRESDMKTQALAYQNIVWAALTLCNKTRDSYACPNNKKCKETFGILENAIHAIMELRKQLWNVSEYILECYFNCLI